MNLKKAELGEPLPLGKTLGQISFEAYNGAGANKGLTYDGKPVPAWENLSEDVRTKWETAAASTAVAVCEMVKRINVIIVESADQMCRAYHELQRFGIPFPPPPPPPDVQNPKDA